nr:MAG TPA: hypothetical protein [Caudoviricetes sp.]
MANYPCVGYLSERQSNLGESRPCSSVKTLLEAVRSYQRYLST